MPIFFVSRKEYEAEIARQAMDITESIISELGAELHDDLIQRLTVLRLSLDRLEMSLSDPAAAETLLTSIKMEFREVTQSIRKTSRILLPVYMDDNSFQQNIVILCQNLERQGAATLHFEGVGREQKLPDRAQTHLYRIIQELIHNAFKHSSAWHIWIRMIWNVHSLTIEVEDDGSGFSKIPEFIGLLRNKRNTLKMRSKAIHATVEFIPGNKGLLARIQFPIDHRKSSG